jgi:site-specific DNA-cytosine methylase
MDTMAEAFVFENVKSITKGEVGKSAMEEIKSMLHDPSSYFAKKDSEENRSSALSGASSSSNEKHPYVWVVQYKVISCSDYGVPQRRERCLFVGFRVKRGTPLLYDSPVFKVFEFMERHAVTDKRTIWEVIRDGAKENDKLVAGSKTVVKKKTGHVTGIERSKNKRKGADPRLWRLVPNEHRGIIK